MAGGAQYINREVSDKLYNNLGSRAGRFTADEFYAKLSDDSFRNRVVSSLRASDSAKNSFMKKLTTMPEPERNENQVQSESIINDISQPSAISEYQTPSQKSKYNTDGITGLAPVDGSPEPAKQALFNDRWLEQNKNNYSGKSALDSLGDRFFGRSKDFEDEYNAIPEYTQQDLDYMKDKQKDIDSQMSQIPQAIVETFDRNNPQLAISAGRNPLRKIGEEKYMSTFSAPIDATKLPWQSDEDFKRQINDAELQVAQQKIEEEARNIRSAEEIKSELSEIESKLPESYTLGRAIGAGATPEGVVAKQQYLQVMFSPEMRKLKKRADQLHQQLKMREQIDSIRSIGDDYGKVKTFIKGMKDEKDFESWYTFGLSDMAERNHISDIYEKAAKGKKLTNDELETLKLYNNLQDAKNGAPKAYTWGGNFANTAAFCLEFVLTDLATGGVGGLAGAINKMLKTGAKGSRALVLRKLGANAMYDLAVTPITPMFWNTLSQETLNQYGMNYVYGGNAYVSKDAKGIGERMRRAYAQAFSERFTESIGNIIGQYGLTGRLMRSKWSKDHLNGFFAKIADKFDNTPFGQQVGKINEMMRVSDMPMEVIEEMINIPIQSALLWEDQFHDANGNFVLADPDFYKEILLDTALLGGMSLAGGGAIVGKQKMFERAKLNNDWKKYSSILSTFDYALGIPIENLQNRSAELQNRLDGMSGEQFQFSRYNIQKEKNEIDAAIELAKASGLDYVPKRTDDVEKMDNIYSFVTGNDMSNKNNVSQAYNMLGELPANPGTYDFHIVMENYLQTSIQREGLIKGLVVEMEEAMGPMAYKKDNGKTVKTATDVDGNKWYITDYDEFYNTYAVRDINDAGKTTLKHADDIKSIETESIEDVLAKWMAYERSNVAQAENNPVEAAEDVASSADEVGIGTEEETSDPSVVFNYKEGDRVSFGNTTYKIQRIEGEEVYLETENGMPLNKPVLLKDVRPLTKEENDVVDQAEGSQPEQSENGIQVGSTVNYEGKPYEVTSINDDGTLELTDDNARVKHNVPQDKIGNTESTSTIVTPSKPLQPKDNGDVSVISENAGKVSERISKRWNDAPKQYGFEDRQYVGKTPYNVRYVLTEQGAVTPSHDWHTFKPIDDFIKTALGENANSRAYEQASKRAAVESRASSYNGKAFQDPVFVKDGAVISGNGRTMSGYIAMENGTDKQYIEDLKYAARKFGFTPEQVGQFKNPRIYAEIIDDVELNSDLFDAFNKPTQEGESMIDRAIAFSKKKDNPVIDKLIFEVSKYPTLSELYKNGASCKLIKDMLINSGFLNENQIPTYFNTSTNQFTAEGKALIESVLNGCVLDTRHIMLLNTEGMGNIRTRIARCAPIIMKNISLGSELSLEQHINNAIEYINSAKKDGVDIFGLVVSMKDNNNSMFDDVMYDDWSTIIAIKLLDSDESFKGFLNSYNKFASENNGIDSMFGDEFNPMEVYDNAVKKINDELNKLGNTKEDAKRRKELEAQLAAITESKISQGKNTDEVNGGTVQPAAETSTGTDNAGTEKSGEQAEVTPQPEDSEQTEPTDIGETEETVGGTDVETEIEQPVQQEPAKEETATKPEPESETTKQEEKPAEPTNKELTEDEIRNSEYGDTDVIESAVDFINGNDTSFAAQIAYQNIKEYVRSKSDNSKPNSGNENTTQLASSANATSAGENKPGGNKTGQVDNGTVPGRGGIPTDQESPSKPSGTSGNNSVQGNVSDGVSESSGNIQSGRPDSGSGRGNKLDDERGNKTQRTESSQPNNGTGTDAGSTDISSLEDDLTSLINGFGSHPSIESNPVIVQEEPHSSFIRRKFSSLAKKLFGFDSVNTQPERDDVLSRKRPKIVPVALSTDGMSQNDVILFGKIIFGAAKAGYAVAKTTSLFSKKDFSRYFISKFGNLIKEKMGYDDSHLISLVDEAWNTKLNINGERLPLVQHVENMRDSEIRGWFGKTKEERAEEQKSRNGVVGKNKYADRNEIKEDLPILQPGQWDDVVFAERQFFDPSHNDYDHVFGKGVLVTNGTGTGKTFTGLGVVKRFLKEGKKNILIVCPANMKPDWMKTARFFDMEISELNDKKDAGKDVSITSYENFRDNNEIMSREFDLVVYDECQNIVMNQQGDETLAYNAHIMVTNKDVDSASERMLSATPEGKRRFELSKQKEELNRQLSKAKRNEVFDIRIKIDQVDSEISDITRKLNALKPSLADKAKESVGKTKVLMLSATPFNTVRNLKIAEGIAFNYPKVIRSDGSENTKADAKYGNFMTEWFSGDSRSNDEIDFGDHLLDELETMQFRELENGFDYSRDFPDVSGKVKAVMFNEAWRFIMSSPLGNYATFLSNPIWTTQLFEVMKVSAIKDRIQQHLDMGRKLILFHDRLHETRMSVDASGKEVPPVGPPFSTVIAMAKADSQATSDVAMAIQTFASQFGEILQWEQTLDYRPVPDQVIDMFATEADRERYAEEMAKYNKKVDEYTAKVNEIQTKYPELSFEELNNRKLLPKAPKRPKLKAESVCLFNGECTPKEKEDAKDEFNSDNGNKRIICVNTKSGGAGLSLHDTTGKFQRVMIGLALPVSPIGFIQCEGRPFRFGNMSNGIFEYPLLGIDLEAIIFAQSFNVKAETVENLSHGTQGRGLKASIMTQFYENGGNVPLAGQGVGSKEMDRRGNSLKGMAKAIHDLGVAIKKVIAKSDKSVPEPIGYKMSKLAGAMSGDIVMVPYAGRGCVSRYFDSNVNVESYSDNPETMATLAIVASGENLKIAEKPFEEVNEIKKGDVVIVGSVLRGRVAMETAVKGFKHTNPGGRLIAVVPEGEEFDNAINSLGKEAFIRTVITVGSNMLGNDTLKSRIFVIDRVANPKMREGKIANRIDLSYITSQDELFREIDQIVVPERIIDKEAIKIKKVKNVIAELKKNELVSSVTFNENNGDIHIEYKTTKGFKVAKIKFSSLCLSGSYYYQGNGEWIEIGDLKTTNQDSGWVRAYTRVKEYLDMDTDEMRKALRMDDSVKEEKVQAARDLLKSWVKFIKAASGFNDSQINRIKNGLKPEIDLADITDMVTLDILKEKFDTANESEELQEIFDKAFPIAVKSGVKLDDSPAGPGAAAEYDPKGHVLRFNKLAWNRADSRRKAAVLLHELIHSVTSYALDAYRFAFDVPEKLENSVDWVEKIYRAIQTGAPANVRLLSGSLSYALENTHEFLANITTQEVEDALRKRPMWVFENNGKKRVSGDKVEGWTEVSAWDLVKGAVNEIIDNFDEKTNNQYKRIASSHALHPELQDKIDNDILRNVTSAEQSLQDTEANRVTTEAVTTLLSEAGVNVEMVSEDVANEEAGENTRYRISSEIEKEYPNWMDNQVVAEGKKGQQTQVAGTVGTYKKVGNWIKENLPSGTTVLDASSGMGLGTIALNEMGVKTEDVEPYPSSERMKTNAPTYTSYNDVNKKYDYIISNAVLNVIPDDWRKEILLSMASKMNDGGKMFINTRKAGEEKGIKNKIELDTPQEVLVGTKDKITSYQKFFTPTELKEYVQNTLGDGYSVEIANEKNSGTSGLAAVVVTKNAPVQFRTSDGIVYGYTKNGVIYLNSERLNPNTPIHEYTHLWDGACQQLNPELWRRGKELMKQTSVWNDVVSDDNYANIRNNEDAVASEVHSRLTGKQGAEMLEKLANEGNTATEKITARGLIGKLKKWLDSFWKWTKDTFTNWTKSEADAVTLDEFVNMPIGDLVRGKNPNDPFKGQRRGNQLLNSVRNNVERTGHLSSQDIESINETINLYENGEYISERLLPQERESDRAGIQNGRGIVGLQIAANIKRTGTEASSGTERKAEEQQQNEILKEYSDAVGLTLGTYDEAYDDLCERFGEPIDKGSEAVVWLDAENGRVYKLKSSYYDTPAKSLDAIAIHNSLFSDTAYTVEGTAFESDRVYFIVSQKFVVNDNGIPVTDDDVVGYLRNKGFKYTEKEIGGKIKVRYTNGRILLSDMHEKNIYRDAQTGDLRCIDCIAKFNTPDAGFGGDYEIPDIVGKNDVRFEKPIYTLSQTDNGFYSNALKAVIGIKMEKATPQQWKNMLLKDGGLKAGEDKWIGLSEWLGSSDKKTLTKDEVIDFINNNLIHIEEVNYENKSYPVTGNTTFDELQDEFVLRYTEIGNDFVSLNELLDKAYNEMSTKYGEDFSMAFGIDYNEGGLYIKDVESLLKLPKFKNGINETRLFYTTRGLENKREIALTVPAIESWNKDDNIHFGDAGDGRAIAWARFGDATTKDGERVLFIDEIQSKRHQEGREKGYSLSPVQQLINTGHTAKRNMSDTGWLIYDRNGKHVTVIFDYENKLDGDTIPAAPFEKNWHELAMKRMLRLAAEEGYDYVAWTSGEQQALRYNIGGIVNSLKKLESNDINEQVFSVELNGRGNQYLITNNEGRVIRSIVSEFIDNNLSDIFGKDIAVKMLSSKENTTITNEELRIGGEGMRGFYDNILPKFMDKYGKKWGVKTEDMFIPGLEGKGVTAHAVTVTDEMRESVMQGQPMFDIRRPMTAVEEDMMKRASDLKEYELTFGERLWEFFGDKNKSVKKFLNIAKGRGVKVDSSTDAYVGLESSISRSTDQIEEEYNKPIYNHLCDAVFALKKKFEEFGISTPETSFNDVGLFAMAMHSKERNRKICVDEIESYVRRKLVTTDSYNALNSALREQGTSIREVCTQLYQNSFEDGDFDFGFLDNLGKDVISLAETMKKAAVRKIKGIAKSDVKENRSGMRNGEADEYLAIFDREECRKEIDELKKWRDASNKFVLDEWLKFGAISKEEYKELTSMYENYVPLRGWDIKEELNLDDYLSNAAYNRGSSMVALNKHAFGRESLADNPFTYMKQLAVSSIIRGNRNLARQKMYNLLAENAGKLKDLAYIPKAYQVRTPDGDMEIWFEKPTAEQEDEGYELVATGYNKDYKWHSSYAEQKAKMVEVDFDGEKRFMVFNGKLGISVASAMRMDNDLMRLDDLITRTLQRVTNIHKALLTSSNPMFWYRNSWRDLRQALKIERNENGRKSRNNLLRHYFVAVGNVFMFEMDHGKKSKYYDLYQQFKIDGGRIGWSRMQSIDDLKREIEREMKKRSKSGIYFLTERSAVRLVRKFWNAMSTASEVSVRFAEYLNSLDHGKDREAAARDAREITANFNHKGRGSSFLNIYFEFFSPTLTGDARIVNMVKNSKASRIAVDCALMVSSRIMLSLISAMMCEGDGDDEENTYDLLSEYRKFAYDIIPIPWGEKDRFLIIPRPHIFRGILNIGDQAAAIIRGKKTINEASHDWLMNMVSDWSPIDVEAFDMKNLTIGDKLERMLLPTIARPIIENKQNRDYQGNKIHQDESIFEENTSPEYKKAGSRTGKAFIATSRALNNLAGGTDYRSAEYQIDEEGNIRESGFRGAFDINPSDIQHIIEGYGGGNFTIINNAFKTGESIADWLRSDDKDFDLDWNVIPITNLIMVQAGKSRSGYKYFFAAREQAKKAEDMLRNAEKAMNIDEIEKIHKANDEVIYLYNSYQKLLKKVGKMEYEGMSDSDRKQLQKTKDDLMESFKDDYLAIKNKQEK